MSKYERMTDEQLICKFRQGDKTIMDYLMEKYKNLVRKEANAMFLLGGENDDLIQEGMIGLFQSSTGLSDGSRYVFLQFCKAFVFTRQMYSAIEASKRKKHSPLNSYISFYEQGEDQSTLLDKMEAGDQSNPEELLVGRERAQILEAKLEENLSDLRIVYCIFICLEQIIKRSQDSLIKARKPLIMLFRELRARQRRFTIWLLTK